MKRIGQEAKRVRSASFHHFRETFLGMNRYNVKLQWRSHRGGNCPFSIICVSPCRYILFVGTNGLAQTLSKVARSTWTCSHYCIGISDFSVVKYNCILVS